MMFLDNLPHLICSIAAIVVLFDSMGVSPRMRANLAAAGTKSLVEFTSTQGNEVMHLFSLWFGGAVGILGLFGLIVSGVFPNSLVAAMLGSSFMALLLCLCSICMWQHRRPIMIEQLRHHTLTSAANRFQHSFWLTFAGLVIGAMLVLWQADSGIDPAEVNLDPMIRIVLIAGLTSFLALFLVDVIAFAGIQLLVLLPAITVLIIFYVCAAVGKLFLRTGWLPLKRCLIAYGCAYTIYNLAWV